MCLQLQLRMLPAIIEASIARQHSGGQKAAAGRLGVCRVKFAPHYSEITPRILAAVFVRTRYSPSRLAEPPRSSWVDPLNFL